MIDVAGAIYGIATIALVLGFAFSDMSGRTFVKAFTIVLFVEASVLLTDGILGVRTAIDRSWNVTRHGSRARINGLAKALGGALGLAITLIGLAI